MNQLEIYIIAVFIVTLVSTLVFVIINRELKLTRDSQLEAVLLYGMISCLSALVVLGILYYQGVR